MGIGKKIPVAFAAALLLMLLAALAGLGLSGRALTTMQKDVMARVDDERTVARMESHFKTQVQEWKNLLLRGMDMALLDKHWAAFEAEEAAVAKEARALQPRLTDPAIRATLARFTAAHEKMALAYRDGLDKFKKTGLEPSIGDMAVRGIDREPAAQLRSLQQQIARQSAQQADAAFAAGRTAIWASACILLLAALAGITLGVLLSRSVVRPLRQAIGAAQAVAAGDLGHAIDAQGRDETAQLLSAMAHMQARLRELVEQVRNSAHAVASASTQIASGSSDLSLRTERTAAEIQRAASSMDELDSSGQHNALHAASASELATVANTAATTGSSVVQQAVQAMQGIHAASLRIGDITAVIDGLAFQTNILALNASVEAARAGDQGLGFAVVAEEVRALAQRSADAAREIRSLIGSSTEQVEHGTELVARAGASMAEVTEAIDQVTRRVAAIAEAAGDQTQGLRHMGQTMATLDHGTQQNAALVEQTSAAATSLREQAQRLVQTVDVFRT